MAAGRKTPKQVQLDGLPTIHPNAAGMDSGAELIVVAVPADSDPEPIRAFRTFTPNLHELISWLLACGVDTLAMESASIYWVAIYELFEAADIIPYLANTRHVRMVPALVPSSTCLCTNTRHSHHVPPARLSGRQVSLKDGRRH